MKTLFVCLSMCMFGCATAQHNPASEHDANLRNEIDWSIQMQNSDGGCASGRTAYYAGKNVSGTDHNMYACFESCNGVPNADSKLHCQLNCGKLEQR